MASEFRWIGKSEDGRSVNLKQFDGSFVTGSSATSDGTRVRALSVDLETTGMIRTSDEIIEVGIRPFEFDPTSGQLLSIGEAYQGLNEPSAPLAPVIQQLTGLSDADLKGQRVDWPAVEALFEGADLVIAHNASFDRPFLENVIGASSNSLWGCSARQVNWSTHGFSSAKLELLCIYHGFFVDSHRALADADALLHLLSHSGPRSEVTYLAELYESAQKRLVKVSADQSPFETKDLLKARGYRWDVQNRVWSKNLGESEVPKEITWLESHIYNGKFRGRAQEIPLTDHFKS